MNEPTEHELSHYRIQGTAAVLISRPDLREAMIEKTAEGRVLAAVLDWLDQYALQRSNDPLSADIAIIAETFLDFQTAELGDLEP